MSYKSRDLRDWCAASMTREWQVVLTYHVQVSRSSVRRRSRYSTIRNRRIFEEVMLVVMAELVLQEEALGVSMSYNRNLFVSTLWVLRSVMHPDSCLVTTPALPEDQKDMEERRLRSLLGFVVGWPPRSVGMAETGWVCWRVRPFGRNTVQIVKMFLYGLLGIGRRLEATDAVVESTTSGGRPHTGRARALCGCSSFEEWGGGEHTHF